MEGSSWGRKGVNTPSFVQGGKLMQELACAQVDDGVNFSWHSAKYSGVLDGVTSILAIE